MLSECFVLTRALREAGVHSEPGHPDIKIPGPSTGPFIRVCLDARGSVVRCEGVVKENYDGLWAHADGNHNYFPVIRLAEPLMEAPNLQVPKKGERRPKLSAAERRAALHERLKNPATTSRRFSEGSKTLELLLRLRTKASMLEEILPREEDVILHVCRAYRAATPLGEAGEQRAGTPDRLLEPVPLIEGLRAKAMHWLEACDEFELDALEVLLFTASGEQGQKKAQLVLDIDDPGTTIYGSEVRGRITRALLDSERKGTGPASSKAGSSSSSCAYAGAAEELWMGPFPRVKLPVLGREFYIFSMNSDAKCNLRYGLQDSQIVPVGKDLILRMQDDLSAVVKPARKGKTWRDLAGEKPGTYDLLITYVDGSPQVHPDVADFFGLSDETGSRQFDADSSAVCEALDGIRRKRPGSRLNLFVLRKASEGQAFVALAESPTVEAVLSAAEWWQVAAGNVPLGVPTDAYAIALSVLNQEKKPEWREPSVPYPGQVVALLSQVWLGKRSGSGDGGKARLKLRGAAFGEVLDMMLQKPGKAQEAAEHILSLCLKHVGPLLKGLGRCQGRRKDEDWKLYKDAERRLALRAVSTLGIALYALGSRKEEYMHEAAFQVGRVLALADRLHRCYCEVVRDGSMPTNLIGNAVFDAALDSPERALAALAERMRVYQGWAETVDPESYEGKKLEQKLIAARMAKKTLRRYKTLAVQLHQQGVPEYCDDKMKAHLLLGYLAKEDQEGEDK